jgi:hypothetical protein
VKPNPSFVVFAAVAWAGLTAGCGGGSSPGMKNQDSGPAGTGGALGNGGVGSGGSNADAAHGTGGAKGGAGGTTVPDAPIGTGGLAGQTGGQVGTGGAVGSGGKIGTGGTGGLTGAGGGTGGKTSTGGSSGTGGVIVDGGAPGLGGKTGTGGATGSGGGTPATGGSGGGVGGTSGGTGGTEPGTGGSTAATGGAGGQACPDSSKYVGDQAWQHQLQVTSDAEYCGGSNENRTIEQELAAKGKLRIAPGTYPLPETSGTYDFALPVCFEFPAGTTAPTFAGAGEIRATQSTISPNVYYTYRFSQPLTSAASAELIFQGLLSNTAAVGANSAPFILDGSAGDMVGTSGYSIGICQGATCAGAWSDIGFLGCNPNSYRLSQSTVTFSGGQIVLDLRIGQSMASTEPAMFVAASGTLDGTTFTQTDYWKLVYLPAHHHFVRSFAVLFQTSISGACGLKVLNVDPFNGAQLPKVTSIRCDLSDIAMLTVTGSLTPTP